MIKVSKIAVYRGKWEPKDREAFNESELGGLEIASNKVVASDFGKSLCLALANGGYMYIPMSTEGIQVSVNDSLDLNKVEIVTLGRAGDEDIYRAEVVA